MKSESEQLARDCKMLKTFMISELPKGWIREVDQNYNIVYYDTINKVTTIEHPRRMEFRKIFHKIYKLKQQERPKNSVTRNPNKGKQATMLEMEDNDESTQTNDFIKKARDKLKEDRYKNLRELQTRGRLIIGSSFFKKQLEQKMHSSKSKKHEKKNSEYELLYFDESIKSKARFKTVLQKTIKERRLKSSNYKEKEEERAYLLGHLIEFFQFILPKIYSKMGLPSKKSKDIESLEENGLKIPDFEDLIYISNLLCIDPLNESHLFWILKLALDLTFSSHKKNKNSQIDGILISDIERMTKSIEKY